MGEDVVSLVGVEMRIDGRRLLEGIELRIRKGEHWVILGPNGSGKTTLLSLMGAQRMPSSGEVVILGQRLGRTDVRLLRPRIGYAGHAIEDMLRPSSLVEEIVLAGRQSTLVPWFQHFSLTDRAEASRLLEVVGCSHLPGRTFINCSQGERQRVLLARALMSHPQLLLLDEPFAGLDLPGREQLITALDRGAALDPPRTTVLVTQHLEEVPSSTTHAVLMRHGHILSSGPVTQILSESGLSECFGIDLRITGNLGRWVATVSSLADTWSLDP